MHSYIQSFIKKWEWALQAISCHLPLESGAQFLFPWWIWMYIHLNAALIISQQSSYGSKFLKPLPPVLFHLSADVKFDLTPPRSKSPKNSATTEVIEAETNEENPEISLKAMPSKDWEIDVKSLSSSRLWLQNYGLKKNRLDMHHILPQIGFKHSDGECLKF